MLPNLVTGASQGQQAPLKETFKQQGPRPSPACPVLEGQLAGMGPLCLLLSLSWGTRATVSDVELAKYLPCPKAVGRLAAHRRKLDLTVNTL